MKQSFCHQKQNTTNPAANVGLARMAAHFSGNISLPTRYEWVEQLNVLYKTKQNKTKQNKPKQTHQITNMKTNIISKILLTLALVFTLGSAITPVHGATEGSAASVTGPPDQQIPVVTINSVLASGVGGTGGVLTRGQTGVFVLSMKPQSLAVTTFVKFTVSGTAIPGVDYVPLVSPAFIGQSGFGVLLVKTLPDPRASGVAKAYSVVVTLQPAPGYAVGAPSSAEILIKP